MKNYIFKFVFSAAAVVALPFVSRADLIVSVNGNGGAGIVSGSNPGQSFTALSDQLLSFDFQLETFNPSFPNDPFTLQILQGDGLGGTVLASQTFTVPNNFNGYTGVTFTTPLSVVSGDIYTATLRTDSVYFGITNSPNSTYDGGKAYFGSSPQYQPYYHDYTQFGFQATFADGSDSSVPDATSTLPLLTGVLVGLAALRRKFARA
jgi:hypothetical protein